ncbi:hypothetical protein H8L32_05000 [Undibacterium sp. CY18W]|uniref:Lipoprotein n=1 Tax=Undibacterium hunanense TaxID=2762292 RepID=A0ABR6ZLP7_9BURK|nr:hypothetical protein [Undibacterium hunanense]MBC3916825.1 hypothetical protein [Undibacterium hunanense]
MKILIKSIILSAAIGLAACSPQFDWRETRSNDAPFSILMPGKAVSDTKNMQLEGIDVKMTMLAGEAGGVSFAVGSTKAVDAGNAGLIMEAMKKGMIRNVQGNADNTRITPGGDVEVRGKLRNDVPVLMVGRFLIRGPWVYQIVILGPEKTVSRDVIDTFMTSFKAN